MKRNHVIIAILALVFLLFPVVVTSDYYRHLAIMALMWVVIGGSWNLLAGYTGQISFGHAIFFGTGAYTAGVLADKLGLSAWWGLALGGPAAILMGLIIGFICYSGAMAMLGIDMSLPSQPAKSAGSSQSTGRA